ncbi:MAG: DUF4097 family beta strand repeat-containing protein [Rhodothermales bacterium]
MRTRFNHALLFAAILMGSLQVASAQDISRTFTVQPGELLTMDIRTGGDISITGWDRNEVSVDVRITGRDAESVEVDIDETSRGVAIRTDNSMRRGRAVVEVTVMVPSRFNLDMETTGGDIVIDGVEGDLEGTSMGGDLTLSNLKGKVSMETMGGDVLLRDSSVDGKVSTMGGDVDLRNVTGTVDGSTMGGDVTYDNVSSGRAAGSGNRPVRLNTMGGDVVLEEALFGADVSTMGGEIRVRKAAEFVKASTMGGDITVGEINGWIEAKTMGGDVEVHMVGGTTGDRHVELESMGGDITLTVPKGLSMEFDIEIILDDDSDDYRIDSDFDLDVKVDQRGGRWSSGGRVHATGSVGGGANLIKIKTRDGDVTIREGN